LVAHVVDSLEIGWLARLYFVVFQDHALMVVVDQM